MAFTVNIVPTTRMSVTVTVSADMLPAAPPCAPTTEDRPSTCTSKAGVESEEVAAIHAKRAAMVASVISARKVHALAEKNAAAIKEKRAMLDALFGGEDALAQQKAFDKYQQMDDKVKGTRLQENFGQTKFIKP